MAPRDAEEPSGQLRLPTELGPVHDPVEHDPVIHREPPRDAGHSLGDP